MNNSTGVTIPENYRQFDFSNFCSDADFDSPEVATELERLKKHLVLIIEAAKVDTTKLNQPFVLRKISDDFCKSGILFPSAKNKDYFTAGVVYGQISPVVSEGVEIISKERQRQIAKWGTTDAHDIDHEDQQLLIAALYAIHLNAINKQYGFESFEESVYEKPIVERLTIAGALIAAEIDRLLSIQSENKNEVGDINAVDL